ncbi:MAG: GntR family transcriptional regulator [Spirochaetes bacterium]|nr:MAG: GntR family transcriptional regulator [Spirochaetota bacterium]
MASEDSKLEYFQEINVQKPSDIIIEQIRKLIRTGVLKPGDRLPPERALMERFGVGRGYVREALKRLEFYGILKTEPKKGTVVASLGVRALEGLISNILRIDQKDLESLFETRAILEVQVARLAAHRATEKDITEIENLLEEFKSKVLAGNRALEEDHLFHLKIAEASKNSILSSLISLITPDIINMNRNVEEEEITSKQNTLREHEAVFLGIAEHDPEAAGAAMEQHMIMAYRRRFGK